MPATGKSSCPFGYSPCTQSFGPGCPAASRNSAMASSHERCFPSCWKSTFQYSRFWYPPWSTKALNCRFVTSYRSRSEEHTSELQSLRHLVCRLLLEKKKH